MKRIPVNLPDFAIWHRLAFLSLFLLGCQTKMPFIPPKEEMLRHPQRVAGAPDAKTMRLQTKLARCGAKIITIGEDYLISIPSAQLFPNQSPRLTWASYGLLNEVVIFLKQFHKVSVNVTSYSSCYESAKRQLALTKARAREVANYLWSQGIDSRFIFTDGLGSDKPIMVNRQGGDKAYNSRIEITFRDMII